MDDKIIRLLGNLTVALRVLHSGLREILSYDVLRDTETVRDDDDYVFVFHSSFNKLLACEYVFFIKDLI